jgi:hypothetical protein
MRGKNRGIGPVWQGRTKDSEEQGHPEAQPEQIAKVSGVDRYSHLRALSSFYTTSAWVILCVTACLFFFGLYLLTSSGDWMTGLLLMGGALIVGLLNLGLCLIFSEVIILFVNMADDLNEINNKLS